MSQNTFVSLKKKLHEQKENEFGCVLYLVCPPVPANRSLLL